MWAWPTFWLHLKIVQDNSQYKSKFITVIVYTQQRRVMINKMIKKKKLKQGTQDSEWYRAAIKTIHKEVAY